MQKGFTLIELLIVVAIIAVLAAIAVPNFLEAQTRSKVSRIKSDLRTVGMGIRAYEIDNNRPPPNGHDKPPFDSDFWFWWMWLEMQGRKDGAGRFLTSPIAYMSSMPNDIFNPSLKGLKDNQNMHDVQAISFNWYYANAYGVKLKPPRDNLRIGDLYSPTDTDPGRIYRSIPFRWSIFSPGPDLVWNPGRIYDPTNGTISAGDVQYFDAPGLLNK